MRDHAVILTYPSHFLLTRLTLYSIKEFFPEVSKITILVDDLASTTESNRRRYIQNCVDAYQVDVIPLSRFKFLQPFNNDSAATGWIRQQIVKLHLDLILDVNQCFFTDGDIGFTSHIPFGISPHGFISASSNNSKRSESQDLYISNLLGVSAIEQWRENERVCTSVAAFRDLNMSTIKSLRQFVEKRLNTNFIEHHVRLFRQPDKYTMSEWELLETYRSKILNEKIDWLFCPPRSYIDFFEKPDPEHPQPYFYTCYGNDVNFDQHWWDQMSRHISAKFGKQINSFVLTR